jgi:hypothetical protein
MKPLDVLTWFGLMIIAAALILMANLAFAHEPNSFLHLEGERHIGPHIMSARWCPGSDKYQMWSVDTNGDKVADECYLVFGEHNKVHYKNVNVVDQTCVCKEEEYVRSNLE